MIRPSRVSRFPQLLPNRRAVTLRKRTGVDTFTDYSWAVAQKEPTEQQMPSGQTVERATFVLVQTSETIRPENGDRIVDSDGLVWQIEAVTSSFFHQVHNCTCIVSL